MNGTTGIRASFPVENLSMWSGMRGCRRRMPKPPPVNGSMRKGEVPFSLWTKTIRPGLWRTPRSGELLSSKLFAETNSPVSQLQNSTKGVTPRESITYRKNWIPAFAGMTISDFCNCLDRMTFTDLRSRGIPAHFIFLFILITTSG
jgi:hypothetical protein